MSARNMPSEISATNIIELAVMGHTARQGAIKATEGLRKADLLVTPDRDREIISEALKVFTQQLSGIMGKSEDGLLVYHQLMDELRDLKNKMKAGDYGR